jgi:hypothetical protein
MNNSDWETTGIDKTSVKQAVDDFMAKKEAQELYTDKDVEGWAKMKTGNNSKICCLIYGADGTGKSGIVFDYLTADDIKQGYSMWIIDLEGGCAPLQKTYHENKPIVVINPLVTFEDPKSGTQIDYLKTFSKINAIIRYINTNYEKLKIKAIVFDGLSTALAFAEAQMRLEKNIDPDGGIQLRYWLARNKLFIECLEQIRAITGVAKFFIAHENFVISDDPNKKTSSVVSKTNSMMIQKLHCQRVAMPNTTEFYCTFDKNKYSVTSEGVKLKFCEVHKSEKAYKWNTQEIFKLLSGEK